MIYDHSMTLQLPKKRVVKLQRQNFLTLCLC